MKTQLDWLRSCSIGKRYFTLLLFVLSLTACSTLPQQKLDLSAQIHNGVFTEQIGKTSDTFKVSIPFQVENPKQLQIIRGLTDQATYASFSKAGNKATFFRIYVTVKPYDTALKDYPYYPLFQLARQFEVAYGASMRKILEKPVAINGRNGIYQVYTQQIPKSLNVLFNYKFPLTITYAFYFLDYGNYDVILLIQTNDVESSPINNQNRIQLINQKWPAQRKFINSVQIITN